MANLKLSHLILNYFLIFLPTLALSEPVTLGYLARVELVMLDKESASFQCANNDIPAQIEIDDNTFGTAYADFPTSLLNRPEPPLVSVRRGTAVVTQRVDETPIGLRNDDWNMKTTGSIDFCIGPAKLEVVQGSLDIFAQLGQYEGFILGSDNVLQSLNIEYDTYPSDADLALFLHSKRENFPSKLNAQFVGSATDLGHRILGRLDLDTSQLSVNFTGLGDLDDVTHLTRLNVRLIIEEAGSAAEQLE